MVTGSAFPSREAVNPIKVINRNDESRMGFEISLSEQISLAAVY
jgi:hypothetical protein